MVLNVHGNRKAILGTGMKCVCVCVGGGGGGGGIIIHSFYTALFSASLEQTHCAHVACF